MIADAKNKAHKVLPNTIMYACAVAALLAAGCPEICQADGVSFKGRDISSLMPALENEQIAAINFQDGLQRMIIAVNVDVEEDERCLWLLPVPGAPEEVNVEIQDEYPEFFGYAPEGRINDTISMTMMLLRGWEIAPMLVEVLFMSHLAGGRISLDVYDQTDKWGMHAEVLSARNTADLDAYFSDKGIEFAEGQLATIAPYLNESFSLVAVWIDSMATVRAEFPHLDDLYPGVGRTPCLYLEFPTKKAFYPLKPTRVYDQQNVPLRLHVIGHVAPECGSQEVLQRLEIEHYYTHIRRFDDFASDWADGLKSEDVAYTRLQGDMPANLYTDDLWFKPVKLRKIAYADFLAAILSGGPGFASFAIMLVGLSYLSGGLAGLVMIKRWSRPAKIGCWNVLTLIGLRIALRAYNITGKPGGTKPEFRTCYTWAFAAIFIILTFVIQAGLTAPFWL